MSNKDDDYPLDEFASVEVNEDKATGKFTIMVKGDTKYRHMIAERIGRLTFSTEDLKEWVVGK